MRVVDFGKKKEKRTEREGKREYGGGIDDAL